MGIEERALKLSRLSSSPMSGALTATVKCCTASLQFIRCFYNDRNCQAFDILLDRDPLRRLRRDLNLGVGLKGSEHFSVSGQSRIQVAVFCP
jgi:hypothetical protein